MFHYFSGNYSREKLRDTNSRETVCRKRCIHCASLPIEHFFVLFFTVSICLHKQQIFKILIIQKFQWFKSCHVDIWKHLKAKIETHQTSQLDGLFY